MLCDTRKLNQIKPAGHISDSRPSCIASPLGFFIGIHTMKTCTKCDKSKPLSDFYKHARLAVSHRSECKACSRANNVTYWRNEENKAKAKEYRKGYSKTEHGKKVLRSASLRYRHTKKGKATLARNIKKFQLNHPVQIQCMSALNYAIRSGKLQKPSSLNCSCGQPAEQYHHYKGYAKENWFDVIAKCIPCHSKLHRKVLK